MTMPSFEVIAAAVHLLPALVWGVIAYQTRSLGRDFEIRMSSLRIAPLLAAAMSLHFVLHAVIALTPTELDGRAAGLHRILESFVAVSIVTSIVLFRHMVPTLAVPEEPRQPSWLALNYGSALVIAALAFLPLVFPSLVGRTFDPHLLPVLYALVMVTLALRHARRLARRGAWRAGLAVAELRSPDVIVVGAGVFFTGTMLLMSVATNGTAPASAGGLFLHTAMGLAIAVPFVVRMFGRAVRAFFMSIGMIAATATVYFTARTLGAWAPGVEPGRLIDLAAIAVLLVVIVTTHGWLGRVIDRLVLRRGQGRHLELQAFLYALSPELGVTECCRRALAEACRLMNLRGAAILLRDGGTVTHGAFDAGPLERAWPRGPDADALPERTFSESDLLRELPPTLREALLESEVVWVTPIASPRRRWGHLFGTEGLLTMASSSEDSRDLAAFVGQLALVLDAAELLGRALAVERSLAHAEKLAAIGELAARIAHDIRNPVTAARSLAQQLAREPGSPFAAEHAVILSELERVEHQVADLLRFARRDEFRFEPLDLEELVRATLATLEPRLQGAAIALEVQTEAGIVARGDREKLRHVLINLVENAADALAGVDAGRRLRVALQSTNGTASVSVADTGPGVAADALPHLFEPFFSLKEHGTGLGLAIAKRTIDAHGGRIEVSSPPGGGTTVRVDLPIARTVA